MSRACSICAHPETAAISKECTRLVPLNEIASRYGLKKSSVDRHKINCLQIPRREKTGEKPAPAVSTASSSGSSRFDNSDPKTLIKRAEKLLDDAQQILDNAKNSVNAERFALPAIRETRESLLLLMRLHGMLAADGGVSVYVNQPHQIALSEASSEALRLLASVRDEEELRVLAGVLEEYRTGLGLSGGPLALGEGRAGGLE